MPTPIYQTSNLSMCPHLDHLTTTGWLWENDKMQKNHPNDGPSHDTGNDRVIRQKSKKEVWDTISSSKINLLWKMAPL